MVGFEADGFLQGSERFGQFLAVKQDGAQVEVQFGIVGLLAKSLAQYHFRFLQAPHLVQRHRQAETKTGTHGAHGLVTGDHLVHAGASLLEQQLSQGIPQDDFSRPCRHRPAQQVFRSGGLPAGEARPR
jgi:hypothetical protein